MLLFGIFKHLHGGKRENIYKINVFYVYTDILPHFDNYVNLVSYIQDLQKRKNRLSLYAGPTRQPCGGSRTGHPRAKVTPFQGEEGEAGELSAPKHKPRKPTPSELRRT